MFGDVLRKFGSLVAGATGPIVRARDRVWHLSPEGQALFGSAGPALDAWIADGSAEVVKSGPHRTVYRVVLASGTVYVKHCRINGPRAWAREVIRSPKARLEFENATRLRALGIGAAIPLAWGTSDTRWPGQSFLITRDLVPAIAFPDFVENRTLVPCERRKLAHALGAFLAQLHDNGVAHPDPHPGNLLVEGESLCPQFSLLDVHAVRFGAPLSWTESRANLVRFNRWFQLRASQTDRLRFWRGYCEGRKTLPNLGAKETKELERETLASNRRFWVTRTTRYRGTHRTIRKIRSGRVRGLAVRDLPGDFLRLLLAAPNDLFMKPGTRLLKQCVSSTVAELEMPTPDGPRTVILKRVNVRSTLDLLKNLFRSSAVRRSWLFGHGLCERWLPTPRPLAMFHVYRGGFLPAEGYLLTEKVPHAIGLPEAVKACRDAHVLRAWGEKLARVVRTMHDRGVSHRDLKAPNVMLQNAAIDPANATPVLIDLVGVRASLNAVPFARRAKELARLNASFLATPHVTRTERLRFLRAYLSVGERQLGWKTWWNAVSEATAAKVAKNHRSGRVLG
ncbi:3-deoxy-D-manno-octulosonic-acid kinase [Gemmata sp. SH-PL17]|uniref:lipopolysaccharide kinase InaA family protein n=1 Tax=Gemmata sp. SH-PL17 TaxID=1630693 RepID=UPI00078BD527|nr:lipopolysaccharide kinase InaA family protein [Gemmata sp. SH-PL17]AMV28495.1 3-deoxy-D-manno-octulosonic-acid kinase [Gemmata sp. SH-PL17]